MFEERFRQVHHEYASKAVAEYAEYLLSCPDYGAIELLFLTVAMDVAIDNYIFNELASKTLTLSHLQHI